MKARQERVPCRLKVGCREVLKTFLAMVRHSDAQVEKGDVLKAGREAYWLVYRPAWAEPQQEADRRG